VRRWTLLLAGAALWLFLAAIPALADGGPHVSSANSGASALTADGCAGCHRVHTAQGMYLLAATSEEALCLSCHATAGVGASTDVESGVQYKVANPVGGTAQGASNIIGALRGGGFVSARIDSGAATRAAYGNAGDNASFVAKIGVLAAGEPVTSAHLKLTGAAQVTLSGTAWGSATSGDSPKVSITCTSCHNPHGNNQYRILKSVPTFTRNGAASASDVTTGTATVTDDTTNTSIVSSVGGTDIRNYTVIQADPAGGRYLLASGVIAGETALTFSNTSGDYFHKSVPWNLVPSNSRASAYWDGPNGQPGIYVGGSRTSPNPFEPNAFNAQINAWCIECHSRYLSTGWNVNTGDPTFRYRHSQSNNKSCLTCHVSHGTNATMDGFYSINYPYPDASTSDSSRLLKVDNRGTCQLCHEPTETVKATGPAIGGTNPWTGPTPAPLLP
jgi:predicted CXXCH cytochrome family protein